MTKTAAVSLDMRPTQKHLATTRTSTYKHITLYTAETEVKPTVTILATAPQTTGEKDHNNDQQET